MNCRSYAWSAYSKYDEPLEQSLAGDSRAAPTPKNSKIIKILHDKATCALCHQTVSTSSKNIDHLLFPHHALQSWFEVPIYAPEVDYDQGPFLGYLTRIGWVVDDIIDPKSSKQSSGAVHAVLQRWTYFGMLFEVTKEEKSIRDFSASSNGRTVLQTVPLNDLLDRWISHQLTKSVIAREQEAANLSECLCVIAGVYDTIYARSSTFLDPAFHLSVQLLYEYLVRASTLASDIKSPPIQHRDLLGPVRFCQQSMISMKWCPSDVHMLSETLSMTEMVFASILNPPGPDKDHSKCSTSKCLAYQVSDESKYVTEHTSEDCTCEMVYASQEEVGKVLLSSPHSVPLISTADPVKGRDGRLYADILDSHVSDRVKRYVAISHIWSDGLGNTKNNAVPLCQHKRIINLVANLYDGDKVAFWFDTLCFPLQPRVAYDAALVRMRQSYEDADKVLVLDRYLYQHKCEGMTTQEIAMRVTCAPWNRRLWTLQEGMLAKSIHFQFQDMAFDLGKWLHRHGEDRTTLRELVFSKTWKNYASLRVFETQPSRKMNVIQAKKALSFRLTSCPDDEPLCLGNLLGVDPDKVVQQDSRAARMELIWASLPEQFASTVFWSSPKLTEKGYRWAAASLMADGCGRVTTCSESASWTAGKGLAISLPAIIFHRSSLATQKSFRLVIEKKMRFIVQWDEQWKTSAVGPPIITSPSKRDGFAILLNRPLVSEAEEKADVAFFAQACEVLGTSKGRTEVRILGRVRIYRLEHLKHHPDVFLGGSGSVLDQQLVESSSQEAMPRAERIWQWGDVSEIAVGTIHTGVQWTVN